MDSETRAANYAFLHDTKKGPVSAAEPGAGMIGAAPSGGRGKAILEGGNAQPGRTKVGAGGNLRMARGEREINCFRTTRACGNGALNPQTRDTEWKDG
jgi:hypothetical protein